MTGPDAPIARRIQVTGHVQGVGFRAYVAAMAEQLDVTGFVRNRSDGTVEALLVGASEKVESLLVLCRQGPPMARVDALHVKEAQGIVGPGFQQLPTV